MAETAVDSEEFKPVPGYHSGLVGRYNAARDCTWSVIVDNRIEEQYYAAWF